MAKTQRVLVTRENEKGNKVGQRAAKVELDEAGGVIRLTSIGLIGKFESNYLPGQISAFSIELIEDLHTLAMIYGGGLLGYGVAWLVSRWVKTPVIQLMQPLGKPGDQWVQMRVAGMFSNKATQTLARDISHFLSERGYRGIQPDLSDEAVWKVPVMPVLLGCGGIIAVSAVCVVIIMVMAALGTEF